MPTRPNADQATTPGVIPDGVHASLRRPPAQTYRIHPDFDAVCVWTQNACSVAHMWRTLGRVLGNQLVAWVRKVARVVQRDRRVRFDLYGPREHPLAERVLTRLRSARRHQKWYARPHCSWWSRQRARHAFADPHIEKYAGENPPRGVRRGILDDVTGAYGGGASDGAGGQSAANIQEFAPRNPESQEANNNYLLHRHAPTHQALEPPAVIASQAGVGVGAGQLRKRQLWRGGLKVATWNVRTLGGNRPEVELFLKSEDIAILAVQETRRLDGGWPLRIRGYQCLETPAVQGQRGQVGLALLIRDDIPAFQVGDVNPYTVCARVTLQGTIGSVGVENNVDAGDLLVASVYIPPNGYPTRRVALREARSTAERWARADLDARYILMGDWNTSAVRLERVVLQRWRGRAVVPAAIRTCSGSSLTYQSPRVWRDLDHMVVSPAAAAVLSRPRVNRTWDTSDHWPLEATIRVNVNVNVNVNADVLQGAGRRWGGAGDRLVDGDNSGMEMGMEMGKRMKVQVDKIGGCKVEIAHHNIWDTLLVDQVDGDSDTEEGEEIGRASCR